MQANAVKNISNNLQLQARSQDFCWGGGGGGVRVCASGAKCRAPQARARRGSGGILPQKILKKWVI